MGNDTSAVNKGVPSVLPWDAGGKEKGPLNTSLIKMLFTAVGRGQKMPQISFWELIIKGHPTTLVTIFVNSTLD